MVVQGKNASTESRLVTLKKKKNPKLVGDMAGREPRENGAKSLM